MEQIHLHNLLKEISSRLTCPHCKDKINIQNIELKSQHKNLCNFDAHCEKCNNTLQINAVVESKPSENAQKMNISSQIQEEKETHTAITESEVKDIKSRLQKSQSIKDLFSK